MWYNERGDLFFFFFFTNKSSLYSSLALLYICLTAAPLLFALHSVYPAPLHLLDSHLTQLLDEHLFAPAPACGAQLLYRGRGAAPVQLLDHLFGGRVHLGAQLIRAFAEVDHKISQPRNFAATKFPNNKKKTGISPVVIIYAIDLAIVFTPVYGLCPGGLGNFFSCFILFI